MHPSAWIRGLLLVQGLYFLVTAVWPLVSMRTFVAVTGPKTDDWLVKTVSVLIGVAAVVMLVAWYRQKPSIEVGLLALLSAAALGLVDAIYVAKRVIRRVYLLDGLVETVFVVAWAILWRWLPN